MIRSIAVAVALALSVVACTSQTEETEPTQEQNEKSESSEMPAVEDAELTPS